MVTSKWIAFIVVMLSASAVSAAVKSEPWGVSSNGEKVALYTLANKNLTVTITTYGARIVSIDAADRRGKVEDVVLGHDSLAGYEADHATYFGAVVGRYGNRIAKGTFSLEGQRYSVPTNNNGNALHGGTLGFDRKVWIATLLPNGVEMTLISPDGDMGFPGTLTAHVLYTLEGHSLRIVYRATTTKPTVVNLTNHSYFNLCGNGHGTILDESMMINADRFTPVLDGLIPSGELAPVTGTPFDFRKPTAIGARIQQADAQLTLARGYDHNFVLNVTNGGALHLAAHVTDPDTGRTLTVTTTEPGVQFYSGNFLDGTIEGKSGVAYPQHAGFCLETQHFPDSPNRPNFPTTELKPGHTMTSVTVFTFGVSQ